MNKKANSHLYFNFQNKIIPKCKRSQGEVITTVLIILLVLAAIVIVWQVVGKTVKKGGEQIESQTECIGLNLVVVSAKAETTDDSSGETIPGKVVVRRETGGSADAVEAVIFVNGENKGISAKTSNNKNLEQLESGSADVPGLAEGNRVQIAGKLADGTACGLSEENVAI